MPTERVLISASPWSPGEPGKTAVRSCARPCLVVPDGCGATVHGIREGIAELGDWVGPDGVRWRKLELPATGAEAESGAAREVLEILLRSQELGQNRVQIDVAAGLPEPLQPGRSGAPGSGA